MRLFLASCVLLSGPAVLAQEPEPAPAPSPTPAAVDAPAPPLPGPAGKVPDGAVPGPAAAQSGTDALEDGDILIRAETQGREQGHTWARGFVDLKAGALRIQGDVMDIYDEPRPDGSVGRKLVAEGNVVFLRAEERLAGRRLTMELDTGKGVFEDAVGYLQPGVFVEGKRIERVDADTYRVTGGKFTSCSQPHPRWSFSASSARIDVDDKIVATHVKFRVATPPLIRKLLPTAPVLYLPVFMYPIQEDQRSTGLLFPHFGQSDVRGFNLGTGFFWAMGRSMDQTFYFDRYSKAGYGLGHEFRYLRQSPSRGTFRTYALKPKQGTDWDYEFTWNALQMLPGSFRATLDVRLVSSQTFRQNFNETLDRATSRRQEATLNVQRYFGSTMVQLVARNAETFFARRRREDTRINRQLPLLRVAQSPKKVGGTGVVFSYEARAERLGLGNQERVDSYERFDFAPELSRSFSASFLQFTPRARVQYTHYGASLDQDTGFIEGGALDRRYFEGGVELRGPKLFRVFENPSGFYSPRFKHEIGPELVWRYSTRVDDLERIPQYDDRDRLIGTNQLEYALVQRFLAKRPGPAGKLATHEVLNWRIAQTYYVQIGEGQNDFDPNYPSSSFGRGNRPDHNSPVFSRIRFRPTPRVSSNFDLEYDVNFRQVRSLGLNLDMSGGWGHLRGGWSRHYRPDAQAESLEKAGDTLRGNARLQLGGRIALDGSGSYDVLEKRLLQATGRLRFDVQCCGFMVEVIESRYLDPPDRIVRFSIELANIGSIGNFMGEESDGRGRKGLR